MIAQVDLSVHYSKVEVVAGAKIHCRHYKVVSAFSHHDPDDTVARLEHIFLHPFVCNRFPRSCESLAEDSEEFLVISGFNPVFSFQVSANTLQCFEL